MRKGSCVLYLSSTWHGSGQNTTAIDRLGSSRKLFFCTEESVFYTNSFFSTGLNVDYNCSLVKSEENRKLLSNPPAAASASHALRIRP